jgi:hypothetical protein
MSSNSKDFARNPKAVPNGTRKFKELQQQKPLAHNFGKHSFFSVATTFYSVLEW